jgi:hypothetical protein
MGWRRGTVFIRWLYLILGMLGAVAAFVYMMERTFARYRVVAEAVGDKTDIEWNVLLVVGGSAGLMMIPVGIGFGLMTAVAIHVILIKMRLGPNSASRDDDANSSWVTKVVHRGSPTDPFGTSPQ